MTRKAEIPVLFGTQLLEKRPAVHYQQGTEDEIEITIRDAEGNELNLNNSEVIVRFADGVTPSYLEAEIEISSPTNPLIFTPPETVLQQAGVWIGAAGIKQDEKIKYIYNFWIYNEPSLWATSAYINNTLPQIDELRTYLRDSSAFENELFEKYQYFLTDICEAIINTIKFWNNTPPYTHARNSRTFNYPHILKLGIEIYLMESLLEWARKNRLVFQGGTLAVDDLARFDRYEQIVPAKKQELIESIIRAKATESISRSFRRIG